MSDQPQIKQRLIGAVVLAALGIIFIPMILDNEPDDFMAKGSSIPPKSEHITGIKKVEVKSSPSPIMATEQRIPVDEKTDKTVVSPVKAIERKNISSNSSKEQRQKVKTATSITAKDIKKPGSTTRAWAVQVGSFGDYANAMRLRNKLRKKSHTAFVEKITVNNKTVYRVRTGPFIKRDKAELASQELVKKYKIKGLVVSHP